MTDIDITVKGLDELIDRSLTRVIDEIDPTLAKFVNISTELLSTIEARIKENVSDVLYSLETNLFVLLFAVIVFVILLLITLWLLETVTRNFGFKLETRKFLGMAFLTCIFIWLFVATILSTFPPVQPINLRTLKYILFGVLCAGAIPMLFVWIRWICVHRQCIKTFFVDELCNFQPTKNQIVVVSTIGDALTDIPMNPVRPNVDATPF